MLNSVSTIPDILKIFIMINNCIMLTIMLIILKIINNCIMQTIMIIEDVVIIQWNYSLVLGGMGEIRRKIRKRQSLLYCKNTIHPMVPHLAICMYLKRAIAVLSQ